MYVTILICALITFFLRAFPFLCFRKKEMPLWLSLLSKQLPPAIMSILVLYCLKEFVHFSSAGISQGLAAIVVIISYKWKHNTFFSIFLGTICHMLFLHLI
ncbi:branched-chain amino acid transporter permease [Floccifex sp.]|uniref:branched-chain amino acid transporter permease n=1 Tax=Floccifex sp. TaxID=2815810 RepID=UPI003F04E497